MNYLCKDHTYVFYTTYGYGSPTTDEILTGNFWYNDNRLSFCLFFFGTGYRTTICCVTEVVALHDIGVIDIVSTKTDYKLRNGVVEKINNECIIEEPYILEELWICEKKYKRVLFSPIALLGISN